MTAKTSEDHRRARRRGSNHSIDETELKRAEFRRRTSSNRSNRCSRSPQPRASGKSQRRSSCMGAMPSYEYGSEKSSKRKGLGGARSSKELSSSSHESDTPERQLTALNLNDHLEGENSNDKEHGSGRRRNRRMSNQHDGDETISSKLSLDRRSKHENSGGGKSKKKKGSTHRSKKDQQSEEANEAGQLKPSSSCGFFAIDNPSNSANHGLPESDEGGPSSTDQTLGTSLYDFPEPEFPPTVSSNNNNMDGKQEDNHKKRTKVSGGHSTMMLRNSTSCHTPVTYKQSWGATDAFDESFMLTSSEFMISSSCDFGDDDVNADTDTDPFGTVETCGGGPDSTETKKKKSSRHQHKKASSVVHDAREQTPFNANPDSKSTKKKESQSTQQCPFQFWRQRPCRSERGDE